MVSWLIVLFFTEWNVFASFLLFYFYASIRIFVDCKFMGLFVLLQIFIEIYYDSYERSTLKALQFVCFRICLDFISSLVERYF